MTQCKYLEFGRDRAYYDFNKTVDIERYRLRVAVGYKASMEIFGNKILLCTELAHKLMSMNTVLDDFVIGQKSKSQIIDEFVGKTVITK